MRRRSDRRIIEIIIKMILENVFKSKRSRLITLVASLITAVIFYEKDNPVIVIGGIVVAVVIIAVILLFIKNKAPYSKAEIKNICSKHLKTLALKYNQHQIQDEYGFTKVVGFDKELEYFIKEAMPKAEAKDFPKIKPEIINLIENYLKENEVKVIKKDYSELKTGSDFELRVFNTLKEKGFNASLVAKSGDQGVDLLVSLENQKKVAIQCKFYSKPVGNKAVQEVIAGRGFYKCDYAAVISNQGYTTSAKTLATSEEVKLFSDETGLVEYLKKLH